MTFHVTIRRMASKRTPIKERLEQAEKYKAEGNELFRQKEYRRSIKKYHMVLLQVKDLTMTLSPMGIPTEDPRNQKEKERGIEISRGCYNNLAGLII